MQKEKKINIFINGKKKKIKITSIVDAKSCFSARGIRLLMVQHVEVGSTTH